MNQEQATPILSALAQPTRLTVFSLLARRGREGMLASEVADAVGVPRNLMSAHLAVLSSAGLVRACRSGRNVSYRAVTSTAAELSGFLARLATLDGVGS